MTNKMRRKKTCVDLFSGIGGWALGFKLAGIEARESFEWWKEAATTHDLNLSSNTTICDIRKLSPSDIPKNIDFIVGSPPCTQFSYSNRGGSGDISDGLEDVKKFLEIISFHQPKFWAMENVPRVANVLKNELCDGGVLEQYQNLCTPEMIHVFDFSEVGQD